MRAHKGAPFFSCFFFSTIYVEGVSFLLTNIYILVRMLCDCMRVQREQGESCFIWLCGQVSALASARRARSLLLILFSHCARSVRGIKRPLYCTFFLVLCYASGFSLLALFYFVCVFFIAMIIVYFSVLRAYAPEGEVGWHPPIRQRRRKMPLQAVVVMGHKVTVVRNVGSRTPQGMFYSPRTRNIA